MQTKAVLVVCAMCLAALVGLSEVAYYFSHPHRAGVSPHLIGLAVAIALIAIAQLISGNEKA